MELLEDLFERELRKVNRREGQEGVAHQGEVGERAGLAGAGSVLPPEAVAAPVVADLHAGPMAPDQGLPLLRGAVGGLLAGEIVPGVLGGLLGLLGVNRALHHDDAAGAGKAGGGRLDGADPQRALLGPAVTGTGLDKKRGAGRSAQAWAC